MAVAKLQVQGLPLHRGPVADAGNLEIPAEAFRYALHHILDPGARGAPHGPSPLAVIGCRHDDRTLLGFDAHVFGDPVFQFAQFTLGSDDRAVDFHINAIGHCYRVLAYSRHYRNSLRTRGKEPRRQRWRRAPHGLPSRLSG